MLIRTRTCPLFWNILLPKITTRTINIRHAYPTSATGHPLLNFPRRPLSDLLLLALVLEPSTTDYLNAIRTQFGPRRDKTLFLKSEVHYFSDLPNKHLL